MGCKFLGIYRRLFNLDVINESQYYQNRTLKCQKKNKK